MENESGKPWQWFHFNASAFYFLVTPFFYSLIFLFSLLIFNICVESTSSFSNAERFWICSLCAREWVRRNKLQTFITFAFIFAAYNVAFLYSLLNFSFTSHFFISYVISPAWSWANDFHQDFQRNMKWYSSQMQNISTAYAKGGAEIDLLFALYMKRSRAIKNSLSLRWLSDGLTKTENIKWQSNFSGDNEGDESVILWFILMSRPSFRLTQYATHSFTISLKESSLFATL